MSTLDSQARSIVKALSYRLVGASLTTVIALILTGSLGFSLTFGLLDIVVKIGGYYFHERVWDHINFGRAKQPSGDYEIRAEGRRGVHHAEFAD